MAHDDKHPDKPEHGKEHPKPTPTPTPRPTPNPKDLHGPHEPPKPIAPDPAPGGPR